MSKMNISEQSKEKFIAKTRIQCTVCKEILFSRYEGEMVICRCDDYISIDETRDYFRIGGTRENVLFLNEEVYAEKNRLQELDEVICRSLNADYPGVRFKLVSLDPVTLFHNSPELEFSDKLLKSFINLVNCYCNEREIMRTVIEYDLFDEMEVVHEQNK